MAEAHDVQDRRKQLELTSSTSLPWVPAMTSEQQLLYSPLIEGTPQPLMSSMWRDQWPAFDQQEQQARPTSNGTQLPSESWVTNPYKDLFAPPWLFPPPPIDRADASEPVAPSGLDKFDPTQDCLNFGPLDYSSRSILDLLATGQTCIPSTVTYGQDPSGVVNTHSCDQHPSGECSGALPPPWDVRVPLIESSIWNRESSWSTLPDPCYETTMRTEASCQPLGPLPAETSSVEDGAISTTQSRSSFPLPQSLHRPDSEAWYHNAPLQFSPHFIPVPQSSIDLPSYPTPTELLKAPNMFAYLDDEPSLPSKEDMNPSDPQLIPRERKARWNGDLYKPRWVRGKGDAREGWCSRCKPGRWLQLKTSMYWYHQTFIHGIKAATGETFEKPLDTRCPESTWEGLCCVCKGWFRLSHKGNGVKYFHHAYKCQNSPKPRVPAKRRREIEDDSEAKVRPKVFRAESPPAEHSKIIPRR